MTDILFLLSFSVLIVLFIGNIHLLFKSIPLILIASHPTPLNLSDFSIGSYSIIQFPSISVEFISVRCIWLHFESSALD
jgi:hypothetical protein